MTHNMGNFDRGLRTFVVAPVAIVLAVLAGAGSVLGIILFVVVGIMLATSAVGFCPLYRALGLNTCGTPRHHVHG